MSPPLIWLPQRRTDSLPNRGRTPGSSWTVVISCFNKNLTASVSYNSLGGEASSDVVMSLCYMCDACTSTRVLQKLARLQCFIRKNRDVPASQGDAVTLNNVGIDYRERVQTCCAIKESIEIQQALANASRRLGVAFANALGSARHRTRILSKQ